jgi:DNA-binding transcriptional regulator PaaX
MARTHTDLSIELLVLVSEQSSATPLSQVFSRFTSQKSRKSVYDAVFRLVAQGLLAYANPAKTQVELTSDGRALLSTRRPVRDGVWKLVIFDIPERQRTVRTFLRNRLKSLGFKKWQASIWVSPYRLDAKLEEELGLLAEKFFIRLIKTTDINYIGDLDRLFPN